MARKISDATVRVLNLYRDEIGLKLPIGGGSDCGAPSRSFILHIPGSTSVDGSG